MKPLIANKSLHLCFILFTSILITACQTTPKNSQLPPIHHHDMIDKNTPKIEQNFMINGKIGLVSPTQAGSAFYVWSQQGKNFAIELSGAMNMGQTIINYNGQTATLITDKTTLTAESPEALLEQVTGWQAPISQLAYWVMAQPAPSDSEHQFDNQQRLSTAHNNGWQASFDYPNNHETLPSKVTVRHTDGYRVVLSINRL